jgi:hypothetical protein
VAAIRVLIALLLSAIVVYSQQIGLLESYIQRPLSQYGKSSGISYFFSEPTEGTDGEVGVLVDEQNVNRPSIRLWSEPGAEWLTVFTDTYEDAFWEDIIAPVTSILIGVGAGTAADRDTDGSLLFATGADEEAFIYLQMPHKYKLGTNIVPHVHWSKTTSAGGDVCWRIDYECRDIGEAFSGTSTVSMSYAEDDNDTAEVHALATVTGFDPAISALSAICKFRLWRDVSGDGGTCTDDYGEDARLLEFDVHYQMDRPGSLSQFVK